MATTTQRGHHMTLRNITTIEDILINQIIISGKVKTSEENLQSLCTELNFLETHLSGETYNNLKNFVGLNEVYSEQLFELSKKNIYALAKKLNIEINQERFNIKNKIDLLLKKYNELMQKYFALFSEVNTLETLVKVNIQTGLELNGTDYYALSENIEAEHTQTKDDMLQRIHTIKSEILPNYFQSIQSNASELLNTYEKLSTELVNYDDSIKKTFDNQFAKYIKNIREIIEFQQFYYQSLKSLDDPDTYKKIWESTPLIADKIAFIYEDYYFPLVIKDKFKYLKFDFIARLLTLHLGRTNIGTAKIIDAGFKNESSFNKNNADFVKLKLIGYLKDISRDLENHKYTINPNGSFARRTHFVCDKLGIQRIDFEKLQSQALALPTTDILLHKKNSRSLSGNMRNNNNTNTQNATIDLKLL